MQIQIAEGPGFPLQVRPERAKKERQDMRNGPARCWFGAQQIGNILTENVGLKKYDSNLTKRFFWKRCE